MCLGLAALGAVLMRPAWEGAPGSTSASSRSVVTAVDTELLLLQTVATEAASPALGIRIACLAVAGVALLNFVATAFVSEESHAWLRRLTRFLGPALMLAVIVVDDNLTTFQNAVMTAHLVWFLLPPTDFGPSAASVAAKELELKLK